MTLASNEHAHKIENRSITCCANLNGGFNVSQVVCLLRFYGPVNPIGSCRARSVNLTTHLLGRLSPLAKLAKECAQYW